MDSDPRMRNPMPEAARCRLGLTYGYALGVVSGFDLEGPPVTDLPGSREFDVGERYGHRMRRVVLLRGHGPMGADL
jgi:hypothetical protein